MKNLVEALLEDDHESLGRLLNKLDTELAKPNLTVAFELLDLFWARLAVHIRAENLHLFPALANVAADSFGHRADVPSAEEIQSVLSLLRSDHDFFMKELADIIKAMREMVGSDSSHIEKIADLQRRMMVIKERLDRHNRLEEEQVYVWPALVFDEQRINGLSDRVSHELNNLPPRLRPEYSK